MADTLIARQEELNALREIFKDSIKTGKIVLISGKPGVGKTTLINKFLDDVSNDSVTIFLDSRFYDTLRPFIAIFSNIKDWLQKSQFSMTKPIDEILDLLNIANKEFDSSEIRGDAPYDIFSPILNYTPLFNSLTIKEIQLSNKIKKFLVNISDLLSSINLRLIIVLDHSEVLNELVIKLITNLMDNLPPRIMFILIYELTNETRELYERLGDKLINYEMGIIELSPFTDDDILELFNKENITINSIIATSIKEKLKGSPLHITRLIKLIKDDMIQLSENNIPTIDELYKLYFKNLNKADIELLSLIASLKDPFTKTEIDDLIDREQLKHFINSNIIVHENGLYGFSHIDDKTFFSSLLPNENQRKLHEKIINKLKASVENSPKISFDLISRICWYNLRSFPDENSLRLCILTARIAHDKALFLTALKIHNEAISLTQTLELQNSRLILALLYYWQGVEYLVIDEKKHALRSFEKALKNFERLGNIEGVGATLYMEGLLSEKKGNHKDAIKSFNDAIKMFDSMRHNELSKHLKTHALLKLARANLNLGNINEAIEHANTALTLSHDINNKQLIIHSLYELSLIKYTKGDFNEAIKTLNEALNISYTTENLHIMPQIFLYLGLAHTGLNEIETATTYFRKSIELARETGDKETEGLALAQLGILNSNTGSYNTALNLLKEAHEILLNTENWESIAKVDYMIATVLISLGDIDGAFDSLLNMLDSSTKTSNDTVFFRSFNIVLETLEEMMQRDLWAQLSTGLDKFINAYSETEATELENFFRTLKEIAIFKITKSNKNLITKYYNLVNNRELSKIIETIISKYAPDLTNNLKIT
ncbi:MAG: tetratricopeptide repeat protein [Thermoprotei archaeon]|jgi:tetratricopeptide (TPR) repeat protein